MIGQNHWMVFVLATSLIGCDVSESGGEPILPPTEEVLEPATDALDFVPLDVPAALPVIELIRVVEGFNAPEGVAARPGGGYFISNVAGTGTAKDGVGWISIVSPDGDIQEEKWVDGLNAPKGMIAHNGYLYVTDIDVVRVFDLKTGAQQEAIAVEGATFLNDATVWNDALYVSDSRTGTVHRIVDGVVTDFIRDSELLDGVNGVLPYGDKLLIATMKAGLLSMASADGTLTTLASGMVNADGIGIAPSGGFLVSSWPGDIFYVPEDGDSVKLLDTREDGILQNDLSVFNDIMIVPNWEPGTVTFWRIRN